MPIRAKLVSACGLLSVLAACDSPLDPGTATLSAGCYTLTIDSRDPMRIQLIEEPSDHAPDAMQILPLPGEPASWAEAWWTPTGDLGFLDIGGIRVSLTGTESPFRGRAEITSDIAGEKPKRTDATLTSMACPA